MASNMPADGTAGVPVVDPTLITYTNIIYGLHALAVVVGVTSAATIVGSFVGGLPSIVAVIMNYVRRSAVTGTFLESHFRWQIRTFWFALLWMLVMTVVFLPLVVVLIGYPLLIAGYVGLGIWIIYRVARGWLTLRDRKPMYV